MCHYPNVALRSLTPVSEVISEDYILKQFMTIFCWRKTKKESSFSTDAQKKDSLRRLSKAAS